MLLLGHRSGSMLCAHLHLLVDDFVLSCCDWARAMHILLAVCKLHAVEGLLASLHCIDHADA